MTYRDTTHLIPKLEGNINYESWHLLVSAGLAAAGVWKFIDATAVTPVQDKDERDYQFQHRLEVFTTQAAHARLLIISSCKPHIQNTLINTHREGLLGLPEESVPATRAHSET